MKSANKQHNPPAVYNDTEYKYSSADSIIEITKTSYRNNEVIKREIQNTGIFRSAKEVKSGYFENKRIGDLYINTDKDKIVAYEDEMVFCCGLSMKGKNKLIYHLSENGLIDSLIIIGMENGKRLKFDYQYE